MLRQALFTGAAPNVSDAYTINGQPGDFYRCSGKGWCLVLGAVFFITNLEWVLVTMKQKGFWCLIFGRDGEIRGGFRRDNSFEDYKLSIESGAVLLRR